MRHLTTVSGRARYWARCGITGRCGGQASGHPRAITRARRRSAPSGSRRQTGRRGVQRHGGRRSTLVRSVPAFATCGKASRGRRPSPGIILTSGNPPAMRPTCDVRDRSGLRGHSLRRLRGFRRSAAKTSAQAGPAPDTVGLESGRPPSAARDGHRSADQLRHFRTLPRECAAPRSPTQGTPRSLTERPPRWPAAWQRGCPRAVHDARSTTGLALHDRSAATSRGTRALRRGHEVVVDAQMHVQILERRRYLLSRLPRDPNRVVPAQDLFAARSARLPCEVAALRSRRARRVVPLSPCNARGHLVAKSAGSLGCPARCAAPRSPTQGARPPVAERRARSAAMRSARNLRRRAKHAKLRCADPGNA